MRAALPNGIAIFLCCIAVFLAAPSLGIDGRQSGLLLYLTVGIVSLAGVVKANLPMTPLHGFLSIASVIGFFCAVTLFAPILQLPLLAIQSVPLLLAVVIPGAALATLASYLVVIPGAALATLASYLVVFLVRARNARRWIPFRLFKRTLLLDASVLTVQILFIRFAWPGWQLVQLAAVAALLLVGRKQLLLTLRRRKNRTD